MKKNLLLLLSAGLLSHSAYSNNEGEKICYSIPKMHCQGCVDKVSEELEGVKGVKSVHVDLGNKTATIEVKPGFKNKKSLNEALDDVGYSGSEKSCSATKKF